MLKFFILATIINIAAIPYLSRPQTAVKAPSEAIILPAPLERDFSGLNNVTITNEEVKTIQQVPVPTPTVRSASVAISRNFDENNGVAWVTAYSEIDSCHYAGCPMANGIKAQKGYAACPRNVKLGTKVWIEGFGELICGDRTAKWVDGRYDIFFGYGQGSYDKAIQFGKQKLEVKILD